MISGVGGGDSLAKAAIEAALKRQTAKVEELKSKIASVGSHPAEKSTANFGKLVEDGLQSIDSQVRGVDNLHVEFLQGKLDIHEVAARIQESKIAFDFTMQVRDRFIDAYREVMRMSV